MANLRKELGGESATRVEVIAGDLDVERRWRAEVENLAHNIRGKEREGCARKGLRELLAQGLHVSVGRGRPLAQTHEYIGVEDADRSRVLVREVDAADWQPDVVDDARHPVGRDNRTNFLFDLVGQPRRFLDSRSRRGSHVDFKRAGIDRRKKVLPKKRGKAER